MAQTDLEPSQAHRENLEISEAICVEGSSSPCFSVGTGGLNDRVAGIRPFIGMLYFEMEVVVWEGYVIIIFNKCLLSVHREHQEIESSPSAGNWAHIWEHWTR